MTREWTDQQVADVRARLAEARRQGLWLSAVEARMFLKLLGWWQRISATGWRMPTEGRLETLAEARARGITHVYVSCTTCPSRVDRRYALDDLHLPGRLPLPGDMAFLDIPNRVRFRCIHCGGRRVRLMPCWRHVEAPWTRAAQGLPPGIPLIQGRAIRDDDE